MTRCAIYCRISADKEGRALGVARQEADCRALAERLGWTVTVVYVDNDVSAFSGKARKQYQALLQAIRSGEVDAVLAYAPDRLYRRLADLAEFVDTVRAASCQVQTVAAGQVDLSSAAGLQTAVILGGVAIGESMRTGERIKRKLAERTGQGLPHGGHRPYGWETDRMTTREAEAEWIRWGVKQTIGGVPIRAQYRELNGRGVLSSVGKPWNHQSWRGVLTTARHAGLMPDGQTTAAWPQIISPEEHRAVVRILSDPSRVTTPGRAGRLHLLSGIARCAVGECDAPLRVGKSKGKRTEDYDVYRCPTGRHVVRHREHVEEFVRAVVASYLRRPDVAALLAQDKDEATREARQAAEREAERLRRLIDDAAADHAASGLPFSALTAYTAPLREQLAAADKAATPPRDPNAAFGDLEDADDKGAAFLASSVERQRAIIDALVTIRVGRGPRGNVFKPDGIYIQGR